MTRSTLKISVVTPVLNAAETIGDCMKSVQVQTWADIEHVIVDGGSTDGTIDAIHNNAGESTMVISGPDKGLYDAMNKGISHATGDIIGVLNADDFYADDRVIARVALCLLLQDVDTCYGDLLYVDKTDPDRTVRYWRAGSFARERFRRGWMPPHPAFFARRDLFERYGAFDLAYPIAADYELMLRLLYKNHVSTAYIPEVLSKMRTGGKSAPSPVNAWRIFRENYRAWSSNALEPSLSTFLLKPLLKTIQYVQTVPEPQYGLSPATMLPKPASVMITSE